MGSLMKSPFTFEHMEDNLGFRMRKGERVDFGRSPLFEFSVIFEFFAPWFEEAFIIITDALAWLPKATTTQIPGSARGPKQCKEEGIICENCKKIQRKNWSNMPSKLLACRGFLYKVEHKIGRLQKLNRACETEFKF